MVNRFSSRRQRLGESFLAERLRGAQSYDRIAGFFSSSILEVAGEELQSVSGTVRLICNSVIDARDLEIAKKAAQHAMRREWCDAEPEKLPEAARPRFHRLYRFLASGKLQVKVMPDEQFGLIHGKAGVITLADGRRTAFLGSVNESLTAREYLETTIDPESGEPFLKPVEIRMHGERNEDAIALPPFLEDAYHHAEHFCRLLAERTNAGFVRTLLLRRVGSTIEAGRKTVEKMLSEWSALDDDEDDGSLDQLRTLTSEERAVLQRFLRALEANQERDPKYQIVRAQLLDQGWRELGCIIFSQFFDSVYWLAEQLTKEMPTEEIGLYAGSQRSGIMHNGVFTRLQRDLIKERVRSGEIRILIGTEAASEGLNLQRLGTLINLDLPWNPSRLEQRKGRIQRIGQLRDVVDIYNMRYAGSVEDRVHQLLSERLEGIASLFGQIPDILEDVWIDVALGELEQAQRTIDAVPRQHPFKLRYHQIEQIDWESCARVLDEATRKRALAQGWHRRC